MLGGSKLADLGGSKLANVKGVVVVALTVDSEVLLLKPKTCKVLFYPPPKLKGLGTGAGLIGSDFKTACIVKSFGARCIQVRLGTVLVILC